MAEVFGIAANGIGIAAFCVQIVDHVSKIKGFIKSLKEAPQELNDLLDEIALLNDLLLELSGSEGPDVLNSRCTQWCMKAATMMQEILQDCQERMQKRRFRGRLHFVMRDDIEKYLIRLERAKGLLSLGHLAFMSHQTRTLKQKLLENQHPHKSIGAMNSERPHSQALCETHDPVLKVSLPLWLGGKVWELYSARAQRQWTIKLRTYVVLPDDSPILEHARTGNLEEFRQLLSKSPCLIFSRNPDGSSPLQEAVVHANYDITGFITNDPKICDPEDALKILHLVMDMYNLAHVASGYDSLQWICRLLLQGSRSRLIEDGLDEMNHKLVFFPEPGIQREIIQAADPPILEQPLAVRKNLCLQHLFRGRVPLGYFDTDSTLPLLVGTLNSTTVEQWREILPFMFTPSLLMDVRGRRKENSDHSELLFEAVSHGLNFATLIDGITPMLIVICQYWRYYDIVQHYPVFRDHSGLGKLYLQSPLTFWAGALLDAGVDLLSYGKEEKQIHISRDIMRLIPHVFFHEPGVYTRFIGFTYGPKPEDWRAYFSNWRDEFAGEFWYMVEHPELVQIPGSWVYDEYPWAMDDDSYY